MLELDGVGKSYGGKTVIESASLSLAAGEIICLTGPSGVGKTTLLEIMAGTARPDRGTVRRSVEAALMFQDDVLIPWLTAEETIAYILPPALTHGEEKTRAAFWLEKFGLERGMHPAAMSGGMRRRLSLARTLAADRPLILLDEPFAFLDERYCRIIAGEIAAHAAVGRGVVLTSHTALPLMPPHFPGPPPRFIAVERAPVIIREKDDTR